MSKIRLIFFFIFLSATCLHAYAAKPIREAPAPTSAVFSVKIDYTNGLIVVGGENLSPSTTTATIGGAPLAVDATSTDMTLFFPFSSDVSVVVSELGNYVLSIASDGGNFTESIFIPFALVTPDDPLPPGEDCPCSPEWDQKSNAPSPNGFAGLTPYCDQDTGSFLTVQFYDLAVGNYWVLWSGWDGSAGYCELFIDGPNRSLTSQDEFDACAGYLRNIVTVWSSQGNDCLF